MGYIDWLVSLSGTFEDSAGSAVGVTVRTPALFGLCIPEPIAKEIEELKQVLDRRARKLRLSPCW